MDELFYSVLEEPLMDKFKDIFFVFILYYVNI